MLESTTLDGHKKLGRPRVIIHRLPEQGDADASSVERLNGHYIRICIYVCIRICIYIDLRIFIRICIYIDIRIYIDMYL